jgi:pheromone shutdown protein TraB
MARKIADISSSGKVVGVIGAGHMKGILSQIEHPVEDLARLEEVPEKKDGVMKWVFPLAIFALVVAGFFVGGSKQGIDMIKLWVITTMVCTGLATILALAHPITVIVAAVVAPMTTLHPALASGWFAGLCEAYLKKPKVSDFQTIHEDILKFRGWYRNPITRILLVVTFSNLGSSIGVFIAAPILAKMVMSG